MIFEFALQTKIWKRWCVILIQLLNNSKEYSGQVKERLWRNLKQGSIINCVQWIIWKWIVCPNRKSNRTTTSDKIDKPSAKGANSHEVSGISGEAAIIHVLNSTKLALVGEYKEKSLKKFYLETVPIRLGDIANMRIGYLDETITRHGGVSIMLWGFSWAAETG